jgi:phospholipase D-like protein/putative oligomerization/nucleic acid binding protein
MDGYPLLNLFWTMLEFFILVAWIWLLIAVIGDVFRSRDLSGWGKGLWAIFIVVVPWVGVLVYLIARGDRMHDRAAEDAARREQAYRDYVKQTAGSSTSVADEVSKLAELHKAGQLTDSEFAAQKAKVLAG